MNWYKRLKERVLWRLKYKEVKRYSLNGIVSRCPYCDAFDDCCSAFKYYCQYNTVFKLRKKKKDEKA